MNNVSQNGMKVAQNKDSIIVNGVEYRLPEKVKSQGANRLTMRNGKITVNGFRFNPETGEFTRAIPWFWIGVLAAILYIVFG